MRELRHSGRPESAAPIDRESELAVDELFISVTDRKGIIRLGNDVFVRVSKFAREELVGQPHNVIRHPDMPRCVFQALWDFLAAGKSVAAYVKNKAKDGSYYWVMAVVVPARDGYASVRLKPTTPLLAKVEAPEQACAAALMLRAEIRFTQAIQSGDEPDQIEQAELLSEAVALAPDWPNLCARLARALHAAGDEQAARRHAMRAVALMEQAGPPEDPFDTAFTGTGLQSGWAAEELGALGLLR